MALAMAVLWGLGRFVAKLFEDVVRDPSEGVDPFLARHAPHCLKFRLRQRGHMNTQAPEETHNPSADDLDLKRMLIA
jgi:hypothetical protein